VEPMEKGDRDRIVITEIPYQLQKTRLIEKIAELVKEKKIEGISELRDESDKDGLRVVVELRRGESGEVLLNQLYAQTQLETVFGINIVALVDGQPKILNLKQLIEAFIRHRREVVTRRTMFLLRQARERGHVLEGLAVAIANIDAVIELIKASPSAAEAREALIARAWDAAAVMPFLTVAGHDASLPDGVDPQCGLHPDGYHLSEPQARAILELRLHSLTGMEHAKLLEEYREKLDEIRDYLDILGDPERLKTVIRDEMLAIDKDFGDARRTEIVASQLDLTIEDLIPEEDRVVTISHAGYAKSQPLVDYQAQRRGGTGRSATAVKEEDFVERLLVANTHATILCFTSAGKVYWLKTYQIPLAGRGARGRPLVNLLPLEQDERVTAILPVTEYREDRFVLMATAAGIIKKVVLTEFSRPRSVGLRALDLDPGDSLVGTAITRGDQDVMLFASSGKAVRFNEADVRPMGRTARGVRGMRVPEGERMISLIIPEAGQRVLAVSANGYGKRTAPDEFPVHNRGGQGVIAMQTSARNGPVVGAVQVADGDEIMLISDQGTLVRTRVDEISVLSRNTQGVRLIRVRDNETLVGIAVVSDDGSDDGSEAEA
jgi:DNA gyrase subunit A